MSLKSDKAYFRSLADHISGRVNDSAIPDWLAGAIGGALIAAGLVLAAVMAGPEVIHILVSLFG